MKAIVLTRYGTPESAFEIQERELPVPKNGEVLVRTEVSGLNFADVQARIGVYGDAPKLPCVLGYEVVGRVERLGPDTSLPEGIKPGDRVVAFTRFGGYANHIVTLADAVVKIPDAMDSASAAALATQGVTAWYAAEEMIRLYPGDHVLVHAAAGGVGTILCQIAKNRGCVVYGTASSESKLKFLKNELGVDCAFTYEDYSDKIRSVVGSRGLDVVFDSVGGKSFRVSTNLLGAGGRIVAIGAAEMSGRKKKLSSMLKVATGFGVFSPISWLQSSKSMIGVNMLRIADDRRHVLRRCMENVIKAAERGQIRVIVGGRFKAEQIAEAHEFLGSRKSIGKVVVEW